VVMSVGPALSARVLEQPGPPASSDDGTTLLAAKLDAILVELRRQNQTAA
jgi:hypothetical protein